MSPERPFPLPLEDPAPLLQWLSGTGPEPEQLELLFFAHAWVCAAIGATLADPRVNEVAERAAELLNQIRAGENPEAIARLGNRIDRSRFRAAWVNSFEKIEPFANDISKALVP